MNRHQVVNAFFTSARNISTEIVTLPAAVLLYAEQFLFFTELKVHWNCESKYRP